MQKFSDKLIIKLKSKKGMSLLEVLCAVLILLLVSGGMTSAVSLAANQYQESMRNSEAQILFSSLKAVISHELTYTTLVDDSELGIIFLPPTSSLGQSYSVITTDNSGGDGYGQIVFANPDNLSEYKYILGKSAYTKGLYAKVTSIIYNEDSLYFTVYLSIGSSEKEYYGAEFQVKRLYDT